MPVSALDAKAALVVIDLQQGIAALAAGAGLDLDPVVANSKALADAFRAKGLPVVWVNVSGGAPGRNMAPPRPAPPAGWDVLLDELGVQPGDIKVTKKTWGAFTNTGLDAILREQRVTQVFLTGVSTSIGVESTARFAGELGYNVVLATDAMLDTNSASHDHSVNVIFPRLGETATTQEVLNVLS